MLHALHTAGPVHSTRSPDSADAAPRATLCVGDVIRMLRGLGAVSARQLTAIGISRQYASQLRRRGILERVAHGQSRLAPRFDRMAG